MMLRYRRCKLVVDEIGMHVIISFIRNLIRNIKISVMVNNKPRDIPSVLNVYLRTEI